MTTLSPTRSSAWDEAVLEHVPVPEPLAWEWAEALADAWASTVGDDAASDGEGDAAWAVVPRRASDSRVIMLMAVDPPDMR